jgi:hypothetical protein
VLLRLRASHPPASDARHAQRFRPPSLRVCLHGCAPAPLPMSLDTSRAHSYASVRRRHRAVRQESIGHVQADGRGAVACRGVPVVARRAPRARLHHGAPPARRQQPQGLHLLWCVHRPFFSYTQHKCVTGKALRRAPWLLRVWQRDGGVRAGRRGRERHSSATRACLHLSHGAPAASSQMRHRLQPSSRARHVASHA